ncbi:hypothetical protein [Thermoplasma sp. Kam2015]|uniref:hypothetical protein n=1 Tax=Thermoplasma sp. Kam2015 TaxID=2094122 RepID=UPI00191C773C|nr:hypothetical protein [Thermoplasma sp. Kam2015]
MRKGALRNYVKKRFGNKGFTKAGTIKIEVLKRLKQDGSPAIRKRATFALNARKWGK